MIPPVLKSQLVEQSEVELLLLSLCLVPLPCPWLVHKQPSGAGMGGSPPVGALSMDIPIQSSDPPARWSCLSIWGLFCKAQNYPTSNLVSSTLLPGRATSAQCQ